MFVFFEIPPTQPSGVSAHGSSNRCDDDCYERFWTAISGCRAINFRRKDNSKDNSRDKTTVKTTVETDREKKRNEKKFHYEGITGDDTYNDLFSI